MSGATDKEDALQIGSAIGRDDRAPNQHQSWDGPAVFLDNLKSAQLQNLANLAASFEIFAENTILKHISRGPRAIWKTCPRLMFEANSIDVNCRNGQFPTPVRLGMGYLDNRFRPILLQRTAVQPPVRF
jgi:hypothetical protein